MKFGLIFNPNAGDIERIDGVIRKLEEKLGGYEFVATTPICRALHRRLPYRNCVKTRVMNTWEDSVNAGYILSQIEDIEAVIVIGGDGTLSDVVAGQRRSGKLVPIIGIGIGTANAGPMISLSLNECDLISDEFTVKGMMGIDVFHLKDYIATGFNDVVFSDCIVSTLGGKTVTVDARKFLEGHRIESTPEDIGTDTTCVSLNSRYFATGKDMKISQIIASPIHDVDKFKYMAVTGLMCWMPYSVYRGVLTVTDKPVVKLTRSDERTTLTMKQCILGDKDVIEIRNTKGYVVVDGNPRIDMSENGAVYLNLNRRAALSARFNVAGVR